MLSSQANHATIQTNDGKWKKMALTLDADKPRVYLHMSESVSRDVSSAFFFSELVLIAFGFHRDVPSRPSDSTLTPCTSAACLTPPALLQPPNTLSSSSTRSPVTSSRNLLSCRTFCLDTIEKRDAFFVKMSKRKAASAHSVAQPTTQTRVTRSSACHPPQAPLPQTPLLPRVTASSTPFSSNGLIGSRCEVNSYTQPQPKWRAAPKDNGFTGRGLLAAHPRFALP